MNFYLLTTSFLVLCSTGWTQQLTTPELWRMFVGRHLLPLLNWSEPDSYWISWASHKVPNDTRTKHTLIVGMTELTLLGHAESFRPTTIQASDGDTVSISGCLPKIIHLGRQNNGPWSVRYRGRSRILVVLANRVPVHFHDINETGC